MLNPPPWLLLLPSLFLFFTPTPRFLISAGITNSWKQICYKSAFTISNAALFIIAITPEVHQLSLYLFPHVVSRNFVDNLHAVLVFLHLTQRKNLENKRQTVGNSKIKRGKERKTRVVSLSEFYSAVIFSTLSLFLGSTITRQPISRFKKRVSFQWLSFLRLSRGPPPPVRKSWIKQTFWRLFFFFATPAKRSRAWVIRFGFSTGDWKSIHRFSLLARGNPGEVVTIEASSRRGKNRGSRSRG